MKSSRRDQKWKTIVFSKAAIWVVALTGFLSVLTFMPVHWEVSSEQFTLRWGNGDQREAELSGNQKDTSATSIYPTAKFELSKMFLKHLI